MAVMVKVLIEQNEAMIQITKTQSDKSEILGPSNLARRQAAIQEKSSKIIKVTKFKMIPISRLPVLATPSGRRPNTGTCTESDNVNVSSDVNPSTDVAENNNGGKMTIFLALKTK